MYTSPYLTFQTWSLKREYIDALEGDEGLRCAPFDFQPIDAPERVLAGSHYCYEPMMRGIRSFPMPSAVDREQ